jgi:hypothetical protein
MLAIQKTRNCITKVALDRREWKLVIHVPEP